MSPSQHNMPMVVMMAMVLGDEHQLQ